MSSKSNTNFPLLLQMLSSCSDYDQLKTCKMVVTSLIAAKGGMTITDIDVAFQEKTDVSPNESVLDESENSDRKLSPNDRLNDMSAHTRRTCVTGAMSDHSDEDMDIGAESILDRLSFKYERWIDLCPTNEAPNMYSFPEYYTIHDLPRYAIVIGSKIQEIFDIGASPVYRDVRGTAYTPLEVLYYKLICHFQEEHTLQSARYGNFVPIREDQLLFVKAKKIQTAKSNQPDSFIYYPIKHNKRDKAILADIKGNGKRHKDRTFVKPTLDEYIDFLYIVTQIKRRALRGMSKLPVDPKYEAYGPTVEKVLESIEVAINKGIANMQDFKKHEFLLEQTWKIYFSSPTEPETPNKKHKLENKDSDNGDNKFDDTNKGSHGGNNNRPDPPESDTSGSGLGHFIGFQGAGYGCVDEDDGDNDESLGCCLMNSIASGNRVSSNEIVVIGDYGIKYDSAVESFDQIHLYSCDDSMTALPLVARSESSSKLDTSIGRKLVSTNDISDLTDSMYQNLSNSQSSRQQTEQPSTLGGHQNGTTDKPTMLKLSQSGPATGIGCDIMDKECMTEAIFASARTTFSAQTATTHQSTSSSELKELVPNFLYSIRTGNLDVVKQYVDNGVDIEAKDYEGLTALHYASEDGHLNIVQYLIEMCHVDKEAKDYFGRTSLHLATSRGHLNIVQYLVETCHVDAKAKDDYGRTALHYASEHGSLVILQYCKGTGHFDMEAKDDSGRTALHYAIKCGHLEIIQYLLEIFEVDTEARDDSGWTALHYASEDGHLEIAQYLLETCHVDKEAKDNSGRTALHYATMHGHVNIVQYLLETCQVNTEAKDEDGRTALHYATLNDHVNIVQCFIRNVSHR